MAGPPRAEPLPEPVLNDLLRRVDWRFLLANREAPRILDLGSHTPRAALERIGGTASEGDSPDLALTGFPRRRLLARARRALGPDGEIVCLWRAPRPGGAARARRRLLEAGFADVTVHWPGPIPFRRPQFWLPVESTAAIEHLLATRPPRSRAQRALHWAWRLALRAGILAPGCAVARVRPAAGEERAAQLLLTGGRSSINKAAGLSFPVGASRPASVTKFARVPAAGASLECEAAALQRVEASHPGVAGVPRLLGSERRAGCRAVTETVVAGEPLIGTLSPATFADLAARVTGWLTELVDDGAPRPAAEWRQRLIEEPLARFGRDFGAVAAATAERCRDVLAKLGDLPAAAEHRDCSPWNVVVDTDGSLGLLDWESAEPNGLPVPDLVYFLANAAFVLESALETGAVRPVYSRLLDPETERGRVFARCAEDYCSRLGIPASELHRLRLLCWIVHSHSDHRHLTMAAAGQPSPEALRTSMFLGLVEEELAWNEKGGRI